MLAEVAPAAVQLRKALDQGPAGFDVSWPGHRAAGQSHAAALTKDLNMIR